LGDIVTDLKLTDELILSLFKEMDYQSDSYQYTPTVPRTFIHKLLFKLQTNFADDKDLMNSIPYYWYNHGPYSEIVQEELDNLVRLGILELVESSVNSYYVLKKENFKLELIKDYENDISSLLKKYSVFDLNKLVNDVYYNYAPYEFVPLYKREVLEPLKTDMKNVTNDDEFHEKINLDGLVELLYDCESELPFDKIFSQYSEFFSNFTSILDNLYDEIDLNTFNQTFSVIDKAWYTFAKALRVVKHDNFILYKRKEMQWRDQYWNTLGETRGKMQNLAKIERSSHTRSNLKYSPTARKILVSTVGKYISD